MTFRHAVVCAPSDNDQTVSRIGTIFMKRVLFQNLKLISSNVSFAKAKKGDRSLYD